MAVKPAGVKVEPAPNGWSDSTSVMKRLDKMEELLEKAASKPADRGGSPTPGIVFGGDNPFSPQGNDWPVQKLKEVGGLYSDYAAVELFVRKGNGRMRLSGIGPALVKLAAMSTRGTENNAYDVAKSQGLVTDTYSSDNLEQQYGFCTVLKGKTHGVPGYDWRSQKILLNERRKTALAESSGVTGGYIIPPQFMNELLTIAAEDAFIEPRAKVLPMNARTAEWPMLDITTVQTLGTSPYFGGILAAWQPEAATINESEPAFKQSTWTAWDLVLYAVSSNQLLADNGIGLDALLTQLFGQAITWYKEYAFLRGLGAGNSMPLGVLNSPAAIVQNRLTAATFTLADAAAMMSHLQVRSWDDACWIMHQSVLPQMIQMVDYAAATGGSAVGSQAAGGHLSWTTPYGDGKLGGAAMPMPKVFLNGLPIFFTEKAPKLGQKGDVMLVDWSRYVIGMRLDMQIDVSPHYLFRNNQLAWRVVARCDGKPWLNNSITDAEGWTVSPFVVLGP